MNPVSARRPLRSRDTAWARTLAQALTRAGVKPNIISLASIGFGALAGAALVAAGRAAGIAPVLLFFAAAACIQLRLLCNLLDGMVAVEGGLRTKSGEIYNELPDRFADVFIIVGAGYASPGVPWAATLGWTAAALALITAYTRALGVVAGASQQFTGPMAKPHRMALLTAACVSAAFLEMTGLAFELLPWVLAMMALGCVITIARRLQRILRELESR